MDEKAMETATDQAARLLAEVRRHASEKSALIERLTKERDEINAALKDLGAGEPRKRKPGRPAGSRNRKPALEQAE
jgi:hypothetical protein